MNQDRRSSVANVLANYESAKGDNLTGITMVGHTMIGDNSVKLILKAGSEIGLKKACMFVSNIDCVVPFNQSYTEVSCKEFVLASIIGYRQPSKEISVTEESEARFNKITSSTFLDENLGEIWDKKTVDGKSVFTRANNDDIEKIMTDLQLTASMTAQLDPSLKLASPDIKTGNFAQFFALTSDGKTSTIVGEILKFDSDMSQILVESSKLEIPNAAIIRSMAASSKADVVEYLKKAYLHEEDNSGYAKELDKMVV